MGKKAPAKALFFMEGWLRSEGIITSLVLCLAILSLPLRHGGGIGLASPVSALVWSIILICSSCSLLNLIRNSKLSLDLNDLPLIAATSLFGAFAFWRRETTSAETQLFLVLIAALLIFTAARQIQKRRLFAFLWALTLGASIQAMYAWLLFLGAFDFVGLRSTLLVGGFLQPNLLASFLATALAAAGILLFHTDESAASIRRKCTLYIALFLLMVTIISIGSRTGWIATALIATSSIIWLAPRGRLLYVAVVAAGLLATIVLQSIIPELSDRLTDKATTATTRYEIWAITLSMILENPFFGYGMTAFDRAYAETAASMISLGLATNSLAGLDHPHNFLLYWWFVGGLGTVGAFAIVAAWHLYALSKIKTRERLFFLALMTPIYLHMQTEFPFRLSPLHLFIVISLVAFLSASAFQSSKQIHMTPWLAKSVSASVRTFTVIAGVFLLLESWNSWHIFRATKLPDQHAADLQKVIFPTASLERYEDAVAIVIMQRARASGNLAYYSYVAEWAEQKVEKTPLPQIYEALIEAKIALSDQASAQSYYQEMIYLFPNTKTHFVLQKK